jgi:hypothetical protein
MGGNWRAKKMSPLTELIHSYNNSIIKLSLLLGKKASANHPFDRGGV